MLLDLQRILLGGTRLIGAIRDYTDPTTVTTWKSKKNFSSWWSYWIGNGVEFSASCEFNQIHSSFR